MKRSLFSAGLILIGISATNGAWGASPPGAEKVAPAFGATIVSTYQDGRTGELWLKRDGSYTAQGRRGDPSSGHWHVRGRKLCLRQSHPATLPISFCTPIPEGGMGAPWPAKSVTGDPITVKVVKGHYAGGRA